MLTVVIPVFNGVGHIGRCIHSVAGPEVEIVVVDDGSTDDTADYVEEHWPHVLVLRQRNKGPSAARNAGARAGSGDWIAFLDADDRALPGWAEALSTGQSEDGVVTIASRLLTGDAGVDCEPSWVPPLAEGAEVSFLAGTFAVRRDVFEDVGGYDETLFFGENTELGMRTRDRCDRRGLGIRRVHRVLVEHVRHADAVTRSRTYAARRAPAARRILRRHAERFRNDRSARRTHWRIIAVAERQQGHPLRFAAAALRSFAIGTPTRPARHEKRSVAILAKESAVRGLGFLVAVVIALLGDDGLTRYLRAVRRLPLEGSSRGLRVRTVLLGMPSRQDCEVVVRARPTRFRYSSPAEDDLNVACRLDFVPWEPTSRWFFHLMSRQARGIVDVGAYTGVYALTAAISNPGATVTAFEPNPRMFQCAQTNVRLNGLTKQVDLRQVALSWSEDVQDLYLSAHTSEASLIGTHASRRISVTTKPMDAELEGNRVDLMKIDVEGAEVRVLDGATQTIDLCKPTILMEALTEADLREQAHRLVPHGYAPAIPVATGSRAGDQRNFVWTTPEQLDVVHEALELARRCSLNQH